MNFVPLNYTMASEFVEEYHRHNKKPNQLCHRFSIGLIVDGELIGVGMAGRPVSRVLDNGKTLEISRVCVKGNHKNANSKIYGRMIRIAGLMGYDSIITYTLESEAQSSIKAVGGRIVAKQCGLRQWDWEGRPRKHQEVFEVPKYRWELNRDKEVEVVS